LNKKEAEKKAKEQVWAMMERKDMKDFKKLVPEMAMQYSFELDQFQKEVSIYFSCLKLVSN